MSSNQRLVPIKQAPVTEAITDDEVIYLQEEKDVRHYMPLQRPPPKKGVPDNEVKKAIDAFAEAQAKGQVLRETPETDSAVLQQRKELKGEITAKNEQCNVLVRKMATDEAEFQRCVSNVKEAIDMKKMTAKKTIMAEVRVQGNKVTHANSEAERLGRWINKTAEVLGKDPKMKAFGQRTLQPLRKTLEEAKKLVEGRIEAVAKLRTDLNDAGICNSTEWNIVSDQEMVSEREEVQKRCVRRMEEAQQYNAMQDKVEDFRRLHMLMGEADGSLKDYIFYKRASSGKENDKEDLRQQRISTLVLLEVIPVYLEKACAAGLPDSEYQNLNEKRHKLADSVYSDVNDVELCGEFEDRCNKEAGKPDDEVLDAEKSLATQVIAEMAAEIIEDTVSGVVKAILAEEAVVAAARAAAAAAAAADAEAEAAEARRVAELRAAAADARRIAEQRAAAEAAAKAKAEAEAAAKAKAEAEASFAAKVDALAQAVKEIEEEASAVAEAVADAEAAAAAAAECDDDNMPSQPKLDHSGFVKNLDVVLSQAEQCKDLDAIRRMVKHCSGASEADENASTLPLESFPCGSFSMGASSSQGNTLEMDVEDMGIKDDEETLRIRLTPTVERCSPGNADRLADDNVEYDFTMEQLFNLENGGQECVRIQIDENSWILKTHRTSNPYDNTLGKVDKVVLGKWWQLFPEELKLVIGPDSADHFPVTLGQESLDNIPHLKRKMDVVFKAMDAEKKKIFFETFDVRSKDEQVHFAKNLPIEHVGAIYLFSQIPYNIFQVGCVFFRIWFVDKNGKLECPDVPFTRKAQYSWEQADKGLHLVAFEQSDGWHFGRLTLEREGPLTRNGVVRSSKRAAAESDKPAAKKRRHTF